MNPKRQFIALVGSDDGAIYQIDAIEHKGKSWLVPHWIESPTEGLKRPTRIIRMDQLKYQKLPPEDARGNYFLNEPIPKSVLDGTASAELAATFEILDFPNVSFPSGGGVYRSRNQSPVRKPPRH